MILTELIEEFLDKYCVKCFDDEDSATTELYMDDHKCIEYDDQLYYVPDNNSSFTDEDELLREMLLCTFQF